MKYTRVKVNQLKMYLLEAIKKLKDTFEGIETQEQYETFYNMCKNILQFCNIWSSRLKPYKFEVLFNTEKFKLYDSFQTSAIETVEVMNNLIESYTVAVSANEEYIKRYNDVEERIRMERDINEKLNKEYEQSVKKQCNPIGFKQYPAKKVRRKKTVKKDE